MQTMLTLSPVTNIAILVMAVGQLLLVGAVVFLTLKMKSIVSDSVTRSVNDALSRVQPVIDNVTRVTTQVGDVVQMVAPKVDRMASDSERAVHSVSANVESTSRLVTEGIAKPLANIAALVIGAKMGFSAWQAARTRRLAPARSPRFDPADNTQGI